MNRKMQHFGQNQAQRSTHGKPVASMYHISECKIIFFLIEKHPRKNVMG